LKILKTRTTIFLGANIFTNFLIGYLQEYD
jgi:hypothetical protein